MQDCEGKTALVRKSPDRTAAVPPLRAALRRAITSVLVGLLYSGTAVAQSAPDTGSTPPRSFLGSTLTTGTMADLPLGNNVYSLLENTQSELIADRFNSGGLNTGESSRVGGFLGSWSQTLFRIGDIDVTDPGGSGAPLLFPELLFWQQVDVATGLMPVDVNTSGLGVTLTPRRPSANWTTTAAGSGTGGSLVAGRLAEMAPPIVRLQDALQGSALVSGPLADRLSLVAGGTWARAAKLAREVVPAVDSELASGLFHLIYTPSASIESRTLGWVQHARVPFEYHHLFKRDGATEDQSTHVQSTVERRASSGVNWRAFAGVTARSRTNGIGTATSVTAERLFDGPIPAIVEATGDSTTTRWTAGARITPRVGHAVVSHVTAVGVDVEGARVRSAQLFNGTIGELIDTTPARAWSFVHPLNQSRRHSTSLSAFASDRLALTPTLTLDAAIRFETVAGSADGGTTGVNWQTWLPGAVLRWQFADDSDMHLVAGYRRSANRLNLDLLSFGDPAGTTAVVSRWAAAPGALPPVTTQPSLIVDRVGPGTGGDPSFSRIAPDLKRPRTDEFVVGVDSHRRGFLRIGLVGIARREANIIAVVDTGVPIASYSTIGIADPGHDFFSADDDQILTVYNRLPSSFGRNQYVLTNPAQPAATAFALRLTADSSTDRWVVLFGATASAAYGAAANRGFNPRENDQDVPGELFTNPNAATFARGRLFSDRAFTIKWTTVYRFPGDLHVGGIARYQDGQPFARLVLAPGLNQGAELIRAYPNAGNRFTFTGTLDIRVQKGIRMGRTKADAILDFYNLATRSNEVEEYTVTGTAFRTPTAIEPPHSVHLGLRFTF